MNERSDVIILNKYQVIQHSCTIKADDIFLLSASHKFIIHCQVIVIIIIVILFFRYLFSIIYLFLFLFFFLLLPSHHWNKKDLRSSKRKHATSQKTRPVIYLPGLHWRRRCEVSKFVLVSVITRPIVRVGSHNAISFCRKVILTSFEMNKFL